MRLLGIDYGLKNVGVALSDPEGQFAMPLATIKYSKHLAEEIKEICDKHGVKTIILGESRNYQGEENDIMKKVHQFKKELEALGFEVLFQLEFMTSMEAAHLQGQNDMLDASAAALILKSYLEKTK